MRIIFTFLIMTAITTTLPARAGNDVTAFPLSYKECVVVGDITIGKDGRWAHCHATKTGWFGTIGLLDFYQTQYCLGAKAEDCDQRAQLIFENRAYTPDAKLLLQRVDAGDAQYDDPKMVDTEQGMVMMLVVHTSGNVDVRRYYLWQTDHWQPLDAQAWQRDIAEQLPAGVLVKKMPWPDINTMSAQTVLYQKGDADCCPSGGMANINLILSDGKFSVKSVEVSTKGK